MDLTATKKIPTVEVPILITFPEVVKEDSKAQAEVLKIHRELGIVSLSTMAAKAGYNWKKELNSQLIEKRFEDQLIDDDSAEPEDDTNEED